LLCISQNVLTLVLAGVHTHVSPLSTKVDWFAQKFARPNVKFALVAQAFHTSSLTHHPRKKSAIFPLLSPHYFKIQFEPMFFPKKAK